MKQHDVTIYFYGMEGYHVRYSWAEVLGAIALVPDCYSVHIRTVYGTVQIHIA